MRERQAILAAWAGERARAREAVLATVVRVEGSSYRDVGARMLVLEHGERIGGVSGGCLEQEVTRKAFWLTAEGPGLAAFSTRSEDETRPYGMGCEGVVHVLLERLRPNSGCEPLELIAACSAARAPGVLATVLASASAGLRVGERLVLWPDARVSGRVGGDPLTADVARGARECLRSGSFERAYALPGGRVEIGFERIDPPRSLVVFGAGDDAMPVLRIAKELGWHVTIADGRAHYATTARFPLADLVVVRSQDLPLEGVPVPAGAACVVMSHSFEQDQRALAMLAPLPIAYLGLLGPRARREALLRELGAIEIACAGGLRGPVGLDLGAETPEEIALAIVAEAHACLAGRAGGALSEAAPQPVPAVARPAAVNA